jgi:hypothetical protein
MYAQYILAVLSAAFLILAATRWSRDGGRIGPQARTWLMIGLIFAAVAAVIWR